MAFRHELMVVGNLLVLGYGVLLHYSNEASEGRGPTSDSEQTRAFRHHDVLQQTLFDQLKEQNYAGLVTTITAMRKLDQSISSDLSFVEATALYELSRYNDARIRLDDYFVQAGPEGEFYQEALDLYAQADLALERKGNALKLDLLASRIKAQVQAGRNENALEKIREFLDLTNDPPHFLYYYQGLIQLANGHVAAAKSSLEAYLERAGRSGEVQFHCGDLNR